MICAYVQILTLDNYLNLLQCYAVFLNLNVTGGFWNIFYISLLWTELFGHACVIGLTIPLPASPQSDIENAVLGLCLVNIFWALESLPKGNGSNVCISSVNATIYFLSVHLYVDAGWLYSAVREGFWITVLGNCIYTYILQNPRKIRNLVFVKESVSFKMKLKIT